MFDLLFMLVSSLFPNFRYIILLSPSGGILFKDDYFVVWPFTKSASTIFM